MPSFRIFARFGGCHLFSSLFSSTSPAASPANVDNSYVYDANGELTQVTNNVTSAVTTYSYDPNGDPTPPAGTSKGPNNEVLQDANDVYQYDNQGNRTTQWAQDPAGYQVILQSGNSFTSGTVTVSTAGDYELRLGHIFAYWSGDSAPSSLTVAVLVTPPGGTPYTQDFSLAVVPAGPNNLVNLVNVPGLNRFFFALPNGFPTGAAVTFTALITGPAGYSGSITLDTGSAILYHDTGVTVNTYDYLNRLIEVQQYSPNPNGTTSFTRPSDGVVVQANLTETTRDRKR